MIIAVFGPMQPPSRSGGVEVAAEQLATRMAALGHKVTCYDRGRKGADFYKGIRIRSAWAIPIRGLSAFTASGCAALLTVFSHAHTVHIHAEGPAFWCWLPRLAGKHVVVTIHGLDWQRQKWQGTPAAGILQAGEWMAVRFAQEIITLTQADQAYFASRYGRSTTLIPNGMEPAAKRPAAQIRSRFGLTKDSYLLFLGRLVPEKGIHTLIEAFRAMKTTKRLVIAGAASDTDAYVSRLYALAQGDERILFSGFAEGEILSELYSNAYLYILPSTLEGMPLTLLEALSYGSCCVVSDIPACRETLGDRGILVPPENIPALTGLLQNLCDHPETVSHYKALATGSHHLSWDAVAEKTLELYQ